MSDLSEQQVVVADAAADSKSKNRRKVRRTKKSGVGRTSFIEARYLRKKSHSSDDEGSERARLE